MRSDCKIPLNEFVLLQRGFDLPSHNRNEGCIPVVASTGVAGYHNEIRVNAPGVVIGRSGSIGGGQYLTTDFWPLNTTLWVKDFKGHNPRYVYYLFRSIDFNRFNVGTGVPTLNRNHLSSIDVIQLSRNAENDIADCLGALDDKIQLNQQINQTLEQMAQAIFKSWFVDFEPVKAKIAALEAGGSEDDALLAAMQAISGKDPQQLTQLQTENPEHYATLRATAELFPSAMQESELGEIPAGWFLPSFEELTTAKQGRYLSKDKMLAVANEEFKLPVWGGNGILGYAEKSAYSSPVVLMTCRGSNCGLIKYTESASWVSNNSFACTPCIGSSWFLLNYFQLSTFEDCISGSAQPQITHTALKTKQLKFPVQQQLCERYSEIINPIFDHILQLKKEIITLKETRDSLLPKLLSGELSVNQDAD